MALQIQYDLFLSQDESEMVALRQRLEKVEKSANAVRRGTYAAISEIRQKQIDLEERYNIIEAALCKGKL